MSIQIFLPKLPARRTSPTGNETTQLSLSCTGSRSLMPLLAVSRSVVCCLPKELKVSQLRQSFHFGGQD
jgi:hypothetical protein